MSGATTGSAVISRWLRPAKAAARTIPAFSCCTRPARRRCPGGDWLTLTYRGPNSQNDEFLPRLLAEAEARGRTPDGPLLEVLLVDIHSSANDADHVTELQMHLAPANEE